MNTQQITRTILRALHEQIDPTVDEMEARVAEQGYTCCHALTVKAGAAKAEEFAAGMAEFVAKHNRLAQRRSGYAPGSEYFKYMTEQMHDLRCLIFAWASGDSDIVTACGHNTVPVTDAIDNLLIKGK